jgi:dTDP-4-dehydrorhamnose reductase
MTTVVVFGSDGMLGNYCAKYLSSEGFNVIPLNREGFDANCPNELSKLSLQWPEGSYIINAIGVIPQKYPMENQDNIESSLLFIKVNSVFPHILSYVCVQARCTLIHLTTDCIYDGRQGNYAEGSPPTENNIYGLSKAAGEPQDAMIIRTSIIGEEKRGRRSLLEWVRSHPSGSKISGFSNHLWNGVTCLQIAKIINECIRDGRTWTGVRHIVSPSSITKSNLCELINIVYGLNLTVVEKNTIPFVDKTLKASDDENIQRIQIPTLYQQILEMKQFSSKL